MFSSNFVRAFEIVGLVMSGVVFGIFLYACFCFFNNL